MVRCRSATFIRMRIFIPPGGTIEGDAIRLAWGARFIRDFWTDAEFSRRVRESDRCRQFRERNG